MIYDCFAFFNELDVLDIRLNTLDSVVDKFVLVEAAYTYQNQPKPLYFNENKERFKKFEHKIIHIILNDKPARCEPWDLENFQRNAEMRGLTQAQPDDTIIISDLDEIPRPEKITTYHSHPGFKVFEQRTFYYYLNNIGHKKPSFLKRLFLKEEPYDYWRGSTMVHFKDLTSPQACRNNRDNKKNPHTLIKDGGWHFSFMGGLDRILYKINSFAHTEFNKDEYKDPEKIKFYMKNGIDLFTKEKKYKIVEIDDTFPSYIQKNKEKFKDLILS